ncbi:MAG: polyprenyl synthetase family protein [Candidatus Roizmanbacteria bacterium]
MSLHRPFLEYLKTYVNESAPYLDAFLAAHARTALEVDPRSGEIMDHFITLSKGGKRLRGALMKLGYEMMGGIETQKILRASISTEILHTSLLIHDDIMDRDIKRRGMVTMHEHYRDKYANLTNDGPHVGLATAISGGDIGIFLAFLALGESDLQPQYVQRAVQIMGNYGALTGYGQALDLFHMYDTEGTIEMTLKVHKYKTAYYTGVMPLLIGAVLAGQTNTKVLQILTSFGEAFGWAFQIQDDILGTFGDPKKTGKSDNSDIIEGKRTVLLLEFLQKADATQRSLANKVVGNPRATDADIRQLLQAMRDTGALQSTVDLGWEYVRKAEELTAQLTTDVRAQSIMRDAVQYMMERVQ